MSVPGVGLHGLIKNLGFSGKNNEYEGALIPVCVKVCKRIKGFSSVHSTQTRYLLQMKNSSEGNQET